MNVNVSPGLIEPLSNEPSEAVTLWVSESSLVQTTVSPSSIVTLSGTNPFSPIEMNIVSVSPHSDAESHREAVEVIFVVIDESQGWVSQRSSTPSPSSSSSK